MWKIPVAKPNLGVAEREAVTQVMESGWLTRGAFTKEFEEVFARYVGSLYGVAVNSGTSALMLALRALGVGQGDEVITTCLTCTATINAVYLVGAEAVLLDVEPETLTMDPVHLKRAVTERTKAIMPVHLFGHPADMDPITEIATRFGISILEDACLALGTFYKQRRVGSLGTAACYSFYANKHITTGEGGMVVTSSRDLYERLSSVANLGKAPVGTHMHDHIGYNFKMTELQAAIGLAQMARIDELIQRRIQVASRFREVVEGRDDIIVGFSTEAEWARCTYFAFYVILQTPELRNEFEEYLHSAGIETRSLFSFIPAQPAFRDKKFDSVAYPVASDLYKKGLYITCSPSMTDDEIHYVARVLESFSKT